MTLQELRDAVFGEVGGDAGKEFLERLRAAALSDVPPEESALRLALVRARMLSVIDEDLHKRTKAYVAAETLQPRLDNLVKQGGFRDGRD